MAVNGQLPFIHVEDSNGSPYVGAKLYVYEVETTTERAIYSDSDLTIAMSNPLEGANASDAAGNFPVFYMAAGTYKLRAVTSVDVLIWEYDNLDTGTSAGAGALPISGGGTGAVTAAAARANLDVPSNSELADLAEDVSGLTASLQNIVAQPQGRLTPTSLTPVIITGVIAGTAVYYTPYNGNLCPVYDGVQFNLQEFAELTLSLHANHLLDSIYDVFVINDGGTIRTVTGPAWTTITAGSGARGTGAGTTELVRQAGLLVNANAMATARNGATTYAVAAKCGTYVGSIYIDGVAGQISCLNALGQSRKWGVWNAYNRRPIIMQVADTTASWATTNTTPRPSNNSTANSLTVFSGLAEESFTIAFNQSCQPGAGATAYNGIGWNATTAFVTGGKIGLFALAGAGQAGELCAAYVNPPALGINVVTSLENTVTTGVTFFGTTTNKGMLMTARYEG